MEVIIPLVLLIGLSVLSAAIAKRATAKWIRGRGATITLALFLPGLYVAYVLGVSHLRDDYHRHRSETYDFDGNCVVALGHGYSLDFFDEFPEFSTLSLKGQGAANNYNDNGVPVRLLENGVQRIGVTDAGVYGAASGRNDSARLQVDHYFFLSFADGSNKRFKTEAELRSAVPISVPMNSADELFSMREGKERSSSITWILFGWPIVIAVFAWRRVRRWSTGMSNGQCLTESATRG